MVRVIRAGALYMKKVAHKSGEVMKRLISKGRVLSALVLLLGLLLAQHQTFAAPVTFSDDFNRADGTVDNGWTVEGASKKTYSILSGAVRGDDTSTQAYNNSRLTRQETGLDQTVTVDMKMGTVTASMGPLLREQGTSASKSTSYYSSGGSAIGISKVVNGVVTNLYPSGKSYNSTDTYRQKLSVIGASPTTLCLTVDNLTTSTNVVNNHCITDSTPELQSAGKVAISIQKSSNFMDNFVYEYDDPGATVPPPPTNLSATAGNTQTALAWTAPSSDGGAAITDYVVQYKESSSGTWLTFADGTSTSTNATVTGLTNDTSYDFRVAAVNSVGTGANSSTATATPASGVVAPSAPVNLSATAGNTQTALAWTAPSSDGGAAIIDYVVQYKTSAGSTWLTFADGTSTSTNATVTGLTNGTQYNFRVAAVNSVGTGTNSSVISATPAVTLLTYTVQPEDLWDNGYLLPTDAPRNSSFSRFVFNTTSDFVTINMTTATLKQAFMGVKVDGVVRPSISSASNMISLGNLGQSKHIEITTGFNANPGGVGPAGNYLKTVQYNGDATLAVVTPQAVSDRVLVFGDSISVGAQNDDAPNTAAVNQLRNAGYHVMSEGSSADWLGRWNQGTATAPDFTALINRLVSYAPKTIWVEMGHNDASRLSTSWGGNINNYGTAYTMLIDQLHTALPNAHIFCQSVMATNSGTHKSFGDKQLQICGDSARKAYAAPVNARDFVTGYGEAGTYMFDQFHPNGAGDAMYANRIKEYIANLNPNISKTVGSDNFIENQASSNLEYTIADSSTNNDAKLENRLVKVSLNGDTVSPSDYSLVGTPAVLSLSKEYLNTLSSGTKNLDVYFTGNIKTSSSFIVAQDNAPAPLSAPTNLSATGGSGQATISFTAPADTGDSAIVSYTVTASPGGATATGSNSPLTITGLAAGTYTFTVRATNSEGSGPESLSSNSVVVTTPDVTAPVVSDFTIPATATTLTVAIDSFTATDDTAVTGYLVTQTATVPNVNSSQWSATAPTSYTFASAGSRTLYAWAKDAAGNVSASLSGTVVITLPVVNPPSSGGGSSSGIVSQQVVKPGNQAQIAALTQQVVALQALLAELLGTTAPTTPNAGTGTLFQTDLELGSIHDDVRSLQRFLNTNGFKVAETGPGAPGQETNVFGDLTRQAVAKFQQAKGIAPAVGYFGPVTRGVVNGG